MTHPDLVTVRRVLGGGGATDVGSRTPVPVPSARLAERYTVIPSSAAPRLLVPRGDRRVASSAVRQTSVATSGRNRLRQRALATMFGLGLGRRSIGDLLFRDSMTVDGADPLSAFLSNRVGVPVRISIRFGPPRANRKPILQLLDASGKCVAFVKIGVNDLTRDLVRTEATVLTHLRTLDLDPVRPPRLLHSGPWAEGTELLVVEALPVWGVAPDSAADADAMRIDAMRAVASAEGVDRDQSALDTYLASLEARVGKLGDGPTPNVLRTILQQVRGTGIALPIGAWHGDWNAGNLAIRDGRVLMWDWERYTTGVPVGFDALHYELTRAYVPKVRSASAAAAHVRTRAAEILRPFGIEPAATVWRLYATEIATRFLGDGQETAQSDLGRVAGWIGEAVPDAVG